MGNKWKRRYRALEADFYTAIHDANEDILALQGERDELNLSLELANEECEGLRFEVRRAREGWRHEMRLRRDAVIPYTLTGKGENNG